MLYGSPRVALKAWGVLIIGGLLGLFILTGNSYAECENGEYMLTEAGQGTTGAYTFNFQPGGGTVNIISLTVEGDSMGMQYYCEGGWQLDSYGWDTGWRFAYGNWDGEAYEGVAWWIGEGTYVECVVADTDQDGIPDEYDPYPADPDPFMWQFIKGVRDPETGFFKAYCIRTDRGDNFCFGDMDYWQDCINALYVGCELEIFQEGDYAYSGSQISDYLLGLASSFTPPVTVAKFADGERVVNPASGIEQGQDYQGTETDSESLGKIVDNTSDIASNQQKIADYLKGIDQGIAGLQEGIGNIDIGDVTVEGGGYTGPTATDIANAIDANNKNNEDSVLSGAQSRLAAIEDPEFSDSIDPEDIPVEEDTITGVIQTFMEGNAVSQALQNSGVSIQNPACSLEVNLPSYGTFELSLCEYESALVIFGNVLLGIVGLVSVIMVIRG